MARNKYGQSRQNPRARSTSSFDRKAGNRPQRKAILIVCGGTETEPNYFKSLRRSLKLSTVDVDVIGSKLQPLAIVDRALMLCERRAQEAHRARRNYQLESPPFDEVWCVFDREAGNEPPSFWEAVRKAQANNLHLAVSNPAFEYWFLLHFKDTAQPFHNARELMQALNHRDCLPGYSKGQDVFYDLREHTDMAISRAQRLVTYCRQHGDFFPNPCTTVYELVQSMKDMV